MSLVHDLITLYIFLLFFVAILSWFPATARRRTGHRPSASSARLTEPVLRPLRQIMPRPRVGGVGVDLSVIVAIILLTIINRVI